MDTPRVALKVLALLASITIPKAFADSPSRTMWQTVIEDNLDDTGMPILTPTEVFQRLGDEKGQSAQTRFALGLLAHMGPKVPKSYFYRMARALWQIKDAKAGDAGRAAYELWSEVDRQWAEGRFNVDRLMSSMNQAEPYTLSPAILDQMIEIPMADVELFQRLFLLSGRLTRGATVEQLIPFDLERTVEFGKTLDADWNVIDLRRNGCEDVAWEKNWFLDRSLDLVAYSRPPNRRFEDLAKPDERYGSVVRCYDANSRKLAYALNLLANTVHDDAQVTFKVSRDGGEPVSVSSYEQLLAALGKLGLTVEVSNTRRFANFRNMSIKLDGKWHGIIDIAWMKVNLGGETYRIPSEHSDFNFLVHDGTVRYANTAWYFGAEDTDEVSYRGNAALWHPDSQLEWTWAKPRVVFTAAFNGERTAQALPYFHATADVTRGIKGVWNEKQTPTNSYALFVCSDASVMAVASMDRLPGTAFDGKALPPRVTHAFPIWRSPLSDIEAIVAREAHLSSAAIERLRSAYPADQIVLRDEGAMRLRLQQAFPFDSNTLDRAAHIPGFLAALRSLHEKWPTKAGQGTAATFVSKGGVPYNACCYCEYRDYESGWNPLAQIVGRGIEVTELSGPSAIRACETKKHTSFPRGKVTVHRYFDCSKSYVAKDGEQVCHSESGRWRRFQGVAPDDREIWN